jgi:hypothetical protein
MLRLYAYSSLRSNAMCFGESPTFPSSEFISKAQLVHIGAYFFRYLAYIALLP